MGWLIKIQRQKRSPSLTSVEASENSIQYWRNKPYDRRLDALKNDQRFLREEKFS